MESPKSSSNIISVSSSTIHESKNASEIKTDKSTLHTTTKKPKFRHRLLHSIPLTGVRNFLADFFHRKTDSAPSVQIADRVIESTSKIDTKNDQEKLEESKESPATTTLKLSIEEQSANLSKALNDEKGMIKESKEALEGANQQTFLNILQRDIENREQHTELFTTLLSTLNDNSIWKQNQQGVLLQAKNSIEALRQKVQVLHRENHQLKAENLQLQEHRDQLQTVNDEWSQSYNALCVGYDQIVEEKNLLKNKLELTVLNRVGKALFGQHFREMVLVSSATYSEGMRHKESTVLPDQPQLPPLIEEGTEEDQEAKPDETSNS